MMTQTPHRVTSLTVQLLPLQYSYFPYSTVTSLTVQLLPVQYCYFPYSTVTSLTVQLLPLQYSNHCHHASQMTTQNNGVSHVKSTQQNIQ